MAKENKESGGIPHGDSRLALAWATVDDYLKEQTSTSLDIFIYGSRGLGEHAPRHRLLRAVQSVGQILALEEFVGSADEEEGKYAPPIKIVSSAKERIDSMMSGLGIARRTQRGNRDSQSVMSVTSREMSGRILDERKKADAYVGAFAYHLTDGLMRASIEGDLGSVANLTGQILPAVIEKFTPVIAASRREFEEVDKLPKPDSVNYIHHDRKRGRDSYPRPELFDQVPAIILNNMDIIMERNGFLWDEANGKFVNMLSRSLRG